MIDDYDMIHDKLFVQSYTLSFEPFLDTSEFL